MGAFDALVDLIERFQMIPPRARVLCAVSGGADSVYLLHRLYGLRERFGFTLFAAHYNHNLRGEESLRDEAFVRKISPVALVVGSGEVLAESRCRGAGVEETARAMRYAFLEETARHLCCDRIATAHNADDNAETVLLNLIRGAGLHGLTGIPPVRGKLIRPLLTTQRSDIEDYLKRYSIPHVEDSTNSDDAYSRNRVRHQVIPLLNEMNPWVVPRLADTIGYLREDDSYLQEIADRAVSPAFRQGGGLTIPAAAVAGQPGPIATRMVRRLLAELGAWQFGSAHLAAVAALCRGSDPSAALDLPHGLTARRVYGDLFLGPQSSPAALPTLTLDPDTAAEAELGGWRMQLRPAPAPADHPEDLGHVFLSRAALRGPLVLRRRQTGDEITLPKRPRRTLKKLFIDGKVPRLARDALPILADDSGPLYVPGFGPDALRLAAPGEAAVEVLCLSIKKREVLRHAGE